MAVQIIAGDCVREMAALVSKGIAVDAIVTDPPYHLIQSSRGGSQRMNDPTKPFGRAEARGGFMGQSWDGGDIAFRPETWAAIGAALKPGGYLLAFGGSRTHHRIWCAIEDAGFVIQDTIMWLYGQGFPKGSTQLKPAHEPICVAYKPGGKRVLNIDECRTPASTADIERALVPQANAPWRQGLYGKIKGRNGDKFDMSAGRWPANLCHDGSDEVMEAFAAFGTKTSGVLKAGTHRSPDNERNCYGRFSGIAALTDFGGDTGSAARFFYAAKASKADRADSKHPTVKPVALMRWLVRLVTPPKGTVLDPFAGSGTIAAAAIAEGRNAILIEREAEYIADIRRRVAGAAVIAAA